MNSITVSDDLLERHFAAFEEPNGEGERVIVQEQLPRPLPRARPRVRQAPASVGRKEKEGELPLLSDDCGAGAQVDTQARRGAGVVVVP
ncbi:hypothetical protein [Kitasatospora sp. NPDC001225]